MFLSAKIRKVESKTKKFFSFFAETEYVRHLLWQRYKKTREVQKKNSFFFSLPSAKIFGKAKDTKKVKTKDF